MQTIPPPAAVVRAAGLPRLLIVEDERTIVATLRKQLQDAGYEVVGQTATGEDGVAQAGRLRPDLVLMDIHLAGDMDGVAAAGLIRSRFRLPVVFLTTDSSRAVLDRAKSTGPHGYLLKPPGRRELEVVVETALAKHRMERQQEERERWFAAVLKSIGDGVVAIDGAGRITFMNPVAEALTGWAGGEAGGQPVEDVLTLVHERTGAAVESPLHQAMREGTSIPLANHTVLISRDRSGRPIDDCAAPILGDDGQPLGGVMVFRDVTGQKASARTAAELAAIVTASSDAIVGVTSDGAVASWNPGAEAVFGYAAAEMIGRPLAALSPGSPGEADALLGRALAGEPVRAVEALWQHSAGDGRYVSVSVSPVRDEDGRVAGAAVIARDVTAVKRLEGQFRQAQKMEAVGRLAGGIAHDFNNLLTVIGGFSQVLLGMLPENGKAREHVGQIASAGERAAGLTRQLLAFSRKQVLQVKVVDLAALVADIQPLLARLLGEDIELTTRQTDARTRVRVDPGQIEQVVMNLAANARDAMPTGGRLTVETGSVELQGGYFDDMTEVQAGRHVALAVTDTGCGMDKATLDRVFEPFFTTKEVGRGAGLGLASVYGIVRQSGGSVRVYSEPARGTTVRVYLPAVDDPLPARPPAAPGETPPGTETVLLAEDEDAVRAVARVALGRAGYTVLEAADGEQAVEVAVAHAGRIDLLVTDVVMPRVGGRQVAEAVRLLHPAVRVLYLSGYTEDAVVRNGISESEAAFLQKPFTLDGLARKVRAVLDGSPA